MRYDKPTLCEDEKDTVYLVSFAGASFASNNDMNNQIGYKNALVDEGGKMNIILFASHNSQRLARSVMPAETGGL